MFRKFLFAAFLAVFAAVAAGAQPDTLRVSDKVNIQMVFPTDVTYMDISDGDVIGVRQPGEGDVVTVHNVIIIKAFGYFSKPVSLAVMEANGRMHTWLVVYEEYPQSLYIDLRREGGAKVPSGQQGVNPIREGKKGAGRPSDGTVASTWKAGDAPTLAEVSAVKRGVYHLVAKDYGISVSCDNIFSYSDILYLVFTVTNNSEMSYDILKTDFKIASWKRSKRTAKEDATAKVMSRWGATSVPPGTQAKVVYSFGKLTLSRRQALNVYFVEGATTGRNLMMTISNKDINGAKAPAVVPGA